MPLLRPVSRAESNCASTVSSVTKDNKASRADYDRQLELKEQMTALDAGRQRKRAADERRRQEASEAAQRQRESKAKAKADKKDAAKKHTQASAHNCANALWDKLPVLVDGAKGGETAPGVPYQDYQDVSLGLGTIQPLECQTVLAAHYVKAVDSLSLILPVMAAHPPKVSVDGELVAVALVGE